MTRCSRGVLVAGLVLLLAPALVFAGGFNLAGVGAKGLAMSGAYRAIADDWSAMYWNPAGLAGQGSGVWIEAKSLFPITTVTPDAPSTIPGYDGYYLYRNGVKQTSLAASHPTGSIAFQYQVNEKMTVGIAAFTPSALGAEWNDLFIGPYPGYGESPAYPDKDWSSDMFVLDIHPTIGYQLADWISVGAGIGIKYTSIELQSPVLIPGVDENGDRLPLPGSHYFVDGILKGDGIGLGFTLGVLVHPTDYFHVGVSYIGPTTVPIEGNVEQTVYLPAMAQSANLYAEPNATADFPLPQEFSIGFALDMNDRLTVAFDANWTGWGDLDVVTIEQDGVGPTGAPAEDSDLVLEWTDTWRYNWGACYQATDALELRAGFYYDPTPIPDKTMRPTISDVANKKSVSLGFEYLLGQAFTVAGYYEHLFSFENDAPAYDNDGDGMYDNVPGIWKLNVETFGIQFGYRF